MKRTYTFRELCEILEDYEKQSTGAAAGNRIVRIDMIQREGNAEAVDDNQVDIVAYFDEPP